MKFALVAAIALSLVMTYFAVQNSQHTLVTFLGWYFDGPLVVVLLITFGAGVLATFLATLPGSLRKSIEISKLKSRLTECSTKLEECEKRQRADVSQPNKGVSHEIST
ncbi:MAG: LapA family protein [Desulfobacteraceae bacterium]|nr:LapA family protein [Desulfobacteraceae bacterium]